MKRYSKLEKHKFKSQIRDTTSQSTRAKIKKCMNK